MSSNLMIQYPQNSILSILTRLSNINLRFTCLRIMSDTSRCNLFPREIQRKMLCQIQLLQILIKDPLGLLLRHNGPLRLQIFTLASKYLQKTINNLLCNLHILITWLLKLTQYLLRHGIVLILKLRVDLAIALKECLVLFIDVLRHCVDQSQHLLLGLFLDRRSSCRRWVVCLLLLGLPRRGSVFGVRCRRFQVFLFRGRLFLGVLRFGRLELRRVEYFVNFLRVFLVFRGGFFGVA
mmetsp:Transcript_12291/g.8566  ORF Transcript_12291/g.8566 Transcript_12291/m.8566 type:complete len:237 (-) Transcript_12291:1304-2014(-)